MKSICNKILNFLDFLILKNFSKILEKFHFSISISRHFQFTFHSRSRFWDIFISLFTLDLDIKAFSFHFSFSKWVNQIFISLFTSRNKWTRIPFHFSLLELLISTLAGHCWLPGPVICFTVMNTPQSWFKMFCIYNRIHTDRSICLVDCLLTAKNLKKLQSTSVKLVCSDPKKWMPSLQRECIQM